MTEQRGGGVWVNPTDPFDKVLVVSSDGVVFANPGSDGLSAAVEGLARNDPNVGALLGKVKAVPLASLRGVSCNLNGRDVKFEWGKGKETGSKTSFEMRFSGRWSRC